MVDKKIEEDLSRRIESSIIKNSLNASKFIFIDSLANLPNSIFISSEEIKIELARTNGFTAHTKNTNFLGLHPEKISATVITSIGMALFAHGHHVEAAEVIGKFLENSIYVNDYSFCFMAARCLARANKYIQATELAERVLINDEQLLSFHALLLPLWTEKNMSESEVDLCVCTAKRMAHTLRDRGEKIQASTIYYNLGNMLRKSDLRSAFSNYNKAAKMNSNYFARAYFWREIAGIAFLKKRYTSSVAFYRRSIELENDQTTRLLYADALAFAGHYADSLQELRKSLPEEIGQDHAEWYLKEKAIDFLISFLSLSKQNRVQSNFHGIQDPAALDDKMIRIICMKSLELDALCANSWFNLGGVFYREGSTELALNCFLISALIEPSDIDAWTNAAGLALMSQNPTDAYMTLVCAYWFNGGEFLEKVAERLPSNGTEFLIEFSRAMAFLKRTESSTLLRIHGSDNNWDSYDIPSAH
jgi:tetratricopeptide (TPR) repeat protein